MTRTAACLGCGREPDHGDRFCVDCGLALEVAALDEGHAPPSGVSTISSAVHESHAGRSLLRDRLLAVVAAVLVGLVAWRLVAPPTEGLGGVAIALTAIDARVPDDWAAGSAGEPLIEIDLETLAADSKRDPNGASVPDVTDAALRPLDLGQLTGLEDHWLVVSNQTHLVRVDPATGASELFEVGAQAVGHDGSRLILVQAGTGEIRSASVLDPEGDQRLLRRGGRSRIADLELPGDGTLQVVFWTPSNNRDDAVAESESVTIDLDSGETLSRSTVARWWSPSTEGLVFDPGYGTYETDEDGRPRLLSDGFVQAAGERLALIQRCDEPRVCEQFWLDRESGQRVDRPIPTRDQRVHIADVFGPDDRFVRVDGGSRWMYFDTATGNHLLGPERSSAGVPFTISPEAVSSDGRHLLVPGRDGILVHDLEAGTSGVLAIELPGALETIDLVPKVVGEP